MARFCYFIGLIAHIRAGLGWQVEGELNYTILLVGVCWYILGKMHERG